MDWICVRRLIPVSLIILILSGAFSVTHAQSFGRNKVVYHHRDFRVKQTPHFNIYYYIKNDSAVNYWARTAEAWYRRHQKIFRDSFNTRNPIILYANHADFQQTNAISGLIGTGTQGVTEVLKRRVVMPVTISNSETDHVLGHELVHAFQYHMLLRKNLKGMNSIENIPLWMIEGLAEYMSLGSIDPNTAMWMRDAVKNNDILGLKDLRKGYKYFPYRYGQAFWAFAGGVWGDSVIVPLLSESARVGYKKAIQDVIGIGPENFSAMWKAALKKQYTGTGRDKAATPVGKLLLKNRSSGRINVTPALSPNGKQIVYVSDKDIFTDDIYLADVTTGKTEKKIYSVVSNSHMDDLSFIESGITWSPHSDKVAIVGTSGGKNKLILIDASGRRRIEEREIPGVPAFSYPAWSPKGNVIAFSGLVNGHTDLYLYNLNTRKVLPLTRDGFSELEPSWSPDGKSIVFSTDRAVTGEKRSMPGGMNLAIMDMETGKIRVLDVFPSAENLNPVFSPDGASVYFLSDRDGYRDLYRYNIHSDRVYQLTEYFTGISGITPYSPAFSIAPRDGKIVYTYFNNHEYRLFTASLNDFKEKSVDKYAMDMTAATLPVFPGDSVNIVNRNLASYSDSLPVPEDSLRNRPYNPKLSLDYVGNTGGIGVSTGGYTNRTGATGGANLLFSDMLGNNNLYTGLSLNGEIYDFAGMATYMNRARRFGWGLIGSHIPYRYSVLNYGIEPRITGQDTLLLNKFFINNYRMFEENIGAFGFYPFSQTTRLELGGNFLHYSYRIDQDRYYYYQGALVDYNRKKLDAPSGYSMETLNLNFVKDNSFFGLASPTQGFRYRLGIEKYFGKVNLYTFLADFRKYYFIKPFTLAFRIMHYARLGNDAESDLLYPLTFAYPSLTRGNQVSTASSDSTSRFNINQIYGSRILVGNIEFRIPFTGPKRLAFIKSHIVFSELSLFLDAGLAWNSKHKPSLDYVPSDPQQRVPYYTAGLSYRINLFGAMVIEPYFAIPLQKSLNRKPDFGVNLVPGW